MSSKNPESGSETRALDSLVEGRKDLYRTIISDAIAILKNKKRWTQGAYARDKRDESVYWDAPEATKWCAIGALRKSALKHLGNPGGAAAVSLQIADWIRAHFVRNKQSTIITINDGYDRDEILSLFRKSVAKLK